jgi:hypothetical protein
MFAILHGLLQSFWLETDGTYKMLNIMHESGNLLPEIWPLKQNEKHSQ